MAKGHELVIYSSKVMNLYNTLSLLFIIDYCTRDVSFMMLYPCVCTVPYCQSLGQLQVLDHQFYNWSEAIAWQLLNKGAWVYSRGAGDKSHVPFSH